MKKIDYPREQLAVRLELELAKAFKIALRGFERLRINLWVWYQEALWLVSKG
jgi:hypothetical protein